MNKLDRDTVEIKYGDKWLNLRLLDKRVNPESFRIDWDESTPSFQAINNASFGQTTEIIRINGIETKCYVETSKTPHMEPNSIMFAIVTLTPCNSGEFGRKP